MDLIELRRPANDRKAAFTLLDEVEKKIHDNNSQLGAEETTALAKAFGKRFYRAMERFNGRVYFYTFVPSGRKAWVMAGEKRDYLVHPGTTCTCTDYYLLAKKGLAGSNTVCYHLIAVVLARATGSFQQLELDDDRYDALMHEWTGSR